MTAAHDAAIAEIYALIEAGRFEDAAAQSDDLVDRLQTEGDVPQFVVAAAAVLAAASRRLIDPVGALPLARVAVELSEPGSANAVAADRELGSALLAAGQPREATDVLARAVEAARQAGMDEVTVTTLVARHAEALAAAGRVGEAVASLAEISGMGAQDLLDQLIAAAEDVTALTEPGQPDPDEEELRACWAAMSDGDLRTAIYHLQRARKDAWGRRDVDNYVNLAHSESHLADAAGDRPSAYGALAIGWRTLDEEYGKGEGRKHFEEAMADQIERWGRDGFDRAKDEYLASLPASSPEQDEGKT